MGRDNPIRRQHPEWLMLDDHGETWSMDSGPERKAVLDYSVPEVRRYIENVFETFFVKWGYRGIKLDFWSYGFERKNVRPRHGNMLQWRHWFLSTIHRYTGKDNFFQLCGSIPSGNPMMAQHADHGRIGGDIGFGRWREIKGTAHSLLPLACIPGRWSYLLDADSAGICKECSDDENLTRLAFVHITQGVVGFGGDLPRLSKKHVGWFQRVLRRIDRGYRVWTPDQRAFYGIPLPNCYYVDYPPASPTFKAGIRKEIAYFNWSDTAVTIGYDTVALGIPKDSRIRDYWTGKQVKLQDGQLVAALRPHASAMFEVY